MSFLAAKVSIQVLSERLLKGHFSINSCRQRFVKTSLDPFFSLLFSGAVQAALGISSMLSRRKQSGNHLLGEGILARHDFPEGPTHVLARVILGTVCIS